MYRRSTPRSGRWSRPLWPLALRWSRRRFTAPCLWVFWWEAFCIRAFSLSAQSPIFLWMALSVFCRTAIMWESWCSWWFWEPWWAWWTKLAVPRPLGSLPQIRSKTGWERSLQPSYWVYWSLLTIILTAWRWEAWCAPWRTSLRCPVQNWPIWSTRRRLRCVSLRRFPHGRPRWRALWKARMDFPSLSVPSPTTFTRSWRLSWWWVWCCWRQSMAKWRRMSRTRRRATCTLRRDVLTRMWEKKKSVRKAA